MIIFMTVISPICVVFVYVYKSKIIGKQYVGEHLDLHPLDPRESIFSWMFSVLFNA